jgi:hypothetical protein
MIKKQLLDKYGEYLDQLDISETNINLKLSMIKVKPEYRYDKNNYGNNLKIGSKVMSDLIRYADENRKIITLTPDNIDGVNVNVLTQFYKKFGFKMNKGHNKNFEYRDTMIRYPKLPGMKENLKPMIKSLLREALDKTITCKKCGHKWKLKDGGDDPYVCHKCHPENLPKKQNLNEAILNKTDKDLKIMADFVNFAKDFLDIKDDIKVALAFERTPDLTTSAYYNYVDKKLKVYVKDRAIMDVCRSIAHELVHHKQNLEDRLLNGEKDGADGSDIENEANAIAGVIIRKWGKKHPKLYV